MTRKPTGGHTPEERDLYWRKRLIEHITSAIGQYSLITGKVIESISNHIKIDQTGIKNANDKVVKALEELRNAVAEAKPASISPLKKLTNLVKKGK